MLTVAGHRVAKLCAPGQCSGVQARGLFTWLEAFAVGCFVFVSVRSLERSGAECSTWYSHGCLREMLGLLPDPFMTFSSPFLLVLISWDFFLWDFYHKEMSKKFWLICIDNRVKNSFVYYFINFKVQKLFFEVNFVWRKHVFYIVSKSLI